MFPFLHLILVIVPKNLLSAAVGWLARLEMPRPLQAWANVVFAKIFGIDAGASAEPIESFKSIEDVFTRRLRSGIRPVVGALVSPADGFLARSAPIAQGQLLQAKGIHYSAAELVMGADGSAQIASFNAGRNPGWFVTVYLAPHNYHRVHLPLSGTLECIRYIPGKLWPVNLPYAENFPQLFVANERLVFEFRRAEGLFSVVMVGALNVGRMTTHLWPEMTTNSAAVSRVTTEHKVAPGRAMAAGDELGVFMLGSTVVLIMDSAVAEGLRPLVAEGNRPILMGQSLC